ncbi:MAG: TetR/AcrR family transcriptional regulator [Gordonia sp. (in: high G+C Gram-positive bacteria)]|uniref:TetR/AcrR family transcriptional regulator n=1 Tax=Gordonia sp. (in: high G+C Gram-positive bacteria) TaxID=84139 RepID=UPI003C75498F
MGPTSRKTRIKTSVPQQEQDILAAAAAEFTAVGYRGANMDDVAARAGVSRSTLYRRFPNKDALFRAVAVETFEVGVAALEDAVVGLPPKEAVVEIFALGAEMVETQPLLRRMVHEDHSVRQVTDSIGSLFIEMVTARVGATLRACGAEMPDDDLLEAVEIHVRVVISYLEVPASDPGRWDPGYVRRVAEKHLAPMIY